MTAAPALHADLSAASAFGPEHGRALSNHLPMALVALHRLGASSVQVQRFKTHYTPRLKAAPPAEPWPPGAAWREPFGQPRAYARYVSLFAQWRASEGAGEVLEQALPWLMPGCAAMAFHGFIRTAYAVQAGHGEELDAALASWACRYLPLGPEDALAGIGRGKVTDPEVLLRRLPAGTSSKGLIAQRMAEAANTVPALQKAVPQLAVREETLARLAELAAKAYAASGSFTALHLLTSAHALHVLLPHLGSTPGEDSRLEAIAWYWQAFATGVVAATIRPLPRLPLLEWSDIHHRAVASLDEHVIKCVDSCTELERLHGGPLWRQAAGRAVDAEAPAG
jgi:hypothetical protein